MTGEPVLYVIQQTSGITAGSYVSCTGWVFYNGDNNGNMASLYMEVLVNGNLCAEHTYYSGGWQKIESNVPTIVDTDDPQIIFRIYVQNPDSSSLEVAMDQFSIRYSPNAVEQTPPCGEVLPGSGVSSSATSSATSTVSESSTQSSSSTSSSAAASSSAPACIPNLLPNGDFNSGAPNPFVISVANGGGDTQVSVVTTGVIPLDDGTPFLQMTTTSSPQLHISQMLTGIPSGTTLRCSMAALVPTQTTFDQLFTLNFEINGQSCASVGGLWIDPWATYSNFAVTTASDDPVSIEITFTWNNGNNYELDIGLDNLFVWVDSAENAGLDLCPPSA